MAVTEHPTRWFAEPSENGPIKPNTLECVEVTGTIAADVYYCSIEVPFGGSSIAAANLFVETYDPAKVDAVCTDGTINYSADGNYIYCAVAATNAEERTVGGVVWGFMDREPVTS